MAKTIGMLDKISYNPKKDLVKSAQNLENIGADFLIMPCSRAYYFYDI